MAEGRDGHGRFAPGNPGGPGSPRGLRNREIRSALEDLLSPQRLKAVLASMIKAAIERQDVSAAKVLLDRAFGKVRTEPLPDEVLVLPDELRTVDDVTKASNELITAVRDGVLSPDDALRMSGLVEAARRSIETQEIERRLSALEAETKRKGAP